VRSIPEILNAVLARLSGAFAALYTANGRPPIAPEKLLLRSYMGLGWTKQWTCR
jgi:hypothetical protein